jgi:uncharacterized protein
MKKEQGTLLFSPSDLVRYVQSPFASWMERLCLEQPETKALKDQPDALLSYLAGKGLAHEANYLNALEASSQQVVTIDDKLSNEIRITATLDAMKNGADIIFQACLKSGDFQGFADFLVKVKKPSKLGDYSYEPWDTKLSKQPKAYFIIQLCCYADLLEAAQGVLPDKIAIVLGTQEKVQYRTLDFWAYYRAKKAEFLAQQASFNPNNQPDPFEFKDVGDWTEYVEQVRQQRDHLSKIANITRLHIQKLNRDGITTCEDLINDTQFSIGKMPVQISERLKHQAKLQKETETTGKLAFELLPINQDDPKGLAVLPPHNKADLFFDLEGFPLEEGGLEYLWGCTYLDEQGQRQFWERWAHDHQQEKVAFTDFAEFAYQRWRQNPNMHIYHYGHYEVSVCKRLMGCYGIMENEIDDMLRAGVFVDLYKVIQHSMILGAPSYSIKKAEQLFREVRDTDVASGGESVVVYAQWQETPDGDTWQTSNVLSNIRDYNIDDCNSTQELTQWLRNLQHQHLIDYVDVFASQTAKAEPEQDLKVDPVRQWEDDLRALADSEQQSEDNRFIASQLADLMDFFSRENKPTWWRFFERKEMDWEQLFDDPDCIVDCERTATPPMVTSTNANSALVYEYAFNPSQEFRNRRFNTAFVLGEDTGVVGIADVDDKKGLVRIKGKRKVHLPDYLSLISYEYVNPGVVEAQVRSTGIGFIEEQKLHKPLKDFLLRKPPALPRALLTQIDQARDTDKLNLIIQAVMQLDNSFLSIQGPPGTGKTYTASHVIVELLKQGKKIGISSNSHKAINNLMSAVAQLTIEAALHVPMYKIQANDDDELFALYPVEQVPSRNADDCDLEAGGVFGATAWGFAKVDHHFDYLFVDEAGQVSIAYLIASSRNAHNIVVMGDQMQLPQPLQGTHPGDSGLSILDYQLQQHVTIPVEQGIFLNRSYRMHSAVNQFISEMVYEGRLDNDSQCDKQVIHFAKGHNPALNKSAGIIALGIEHSANKQSSPEEVQVIRNLVDDLLKSQHTNKKGETKQLTAADILVVAPFNHQVNELKKELGFDAKVGTVDLFQGQEAPVVIVSMTASLATESARGADFLLNINRLNVAISRAQALAIVVHSDTLLQGSPSSIADIKRFSFFESLVSKGGIRNN